jgi:hypothetical protein
MTWSEVPSSHLVVNGENLLDRDLGPSAATLPAWSTSSWGSSCTTADSTAAATGVSSLLRR